ncbi:MAG: chorismate mutase [Alphaproteobacteria bacterium]
MTLDAPSLSELRRELDSIDDALHDLVMRRTELVQRIAAESEGGEMPRLVPGREAGVLRRLLARHSGPFPKSVIVRLWRELFSAQRSLQFPFALAVFMPKRGAGYLELAREHYGTYTTTTTYTSSSQVVRAVTDGSAAVGILPIPQEDDTGAWWPALMSDAPGTPRVIARLPFTGPGPGRGDGIEAMAIARSTQDPTGNDRTLLVLETASGISRASLRRAMTDTGLEECAYQGQRSVGDDVWLHLVEVIGYVPSGDDRLHRLCAEAALVKRVAVIGSFAVALSPGDLAT